MVDTIFSSSVHTDVIYFNVTETTTGFFLSVRPRFTHRSDNTEAISGNVVRLRCRVSGFPRPLVTWRKDGNSLRPNRRLKLLANGDLEIMPVVQDDNGYYTCEARNHIGIISHTARIIVKGNTFV